MRSVLHPVGILAVIVAVGCASSTPKGSTALPPDIDPKDPLATTSLLQQGQALLSEGHAEEALKRFQAAVGLQPTNPVAVNMVGLALLRLNRDNDALETFNRALRLAPSYSDARSNRGTTYMKLGQAAMAEADFLAVLGDRSYANRNGVLFNLGSLYLRRGNLLAAEENLRKAATPAGPVDALVLLGEVEHRLGKPEAAENAWREAMTRAPERVDAVLSLARLLETEGRAQEAKELYRRILTVAPSSAEAATARAALGS